MRRLTFISENGKMIPRLADGRRGICLYRKSNQPGGHGGIGRRARFRFWCPRRAGSSPVVRSLKAPNLRGFFSFHVHFRVHSCFKFSKCVLIIFVCLASSRSITFTILFLTWITFPSISSAVNVQISPRRSGPKAARRTVISNSVPDMIPNSFLMSSSLGQ